MAQSPPLTPSEIEEYVRDQVKEWRLFSDIPQSEIAAVLNLKRAAVSRKENGDARFSVSDLVRISVHYQVPINTFIPSHAENIGGDANECLSTRKREQFAENVG